MTMGLSPNAETPIGQLRCESSSCAIGGLAQPIPLRVLQAIGLHMRRLNDIAAALSGVRRARGDGHILAVELADRAERISASLDALGHVHDLAAGNCVFRSSWTPSSAPLTLCSAPKSASFINHPVENSPRPIDC